MFSALFIIKCQEMGANMNIYNSSIIESPLDSTLQEDLENTALSDDLPINNLQDSIILVTGATGLVGMQMVKSLAAMNRLKGTNISIMALVRNPDKAKSIYAELANRGDITFVKADLNDKEGIIKAVESSYNNIRVNKADAPFYIIHGAAVTASKTMVEKPVETIDTAINGTKNMLEVARKLGVNSLVYISSMEVYGSFTEATYVTEDVMGYIDPLVVRSNYQLTKRMCENMCIAYAKEFDIPVKIARLSQTFGAGILPGENRVFAQFARSVMNNQDIVLHTKGLSEGNYCYTADTIRGLLTILIKGENSNAYNVSNEDTHTTIAGMAKFASEQLAGGKIKVIFDIPEDNKFGYAADTKMKLSNKKLKALGWEPCYSLEDAYRRMMASMEQQGI